MTARQLTADGSKRARVLAPPPDVRVVFEQLDGEG
jgi:hypothetical protein